MNAGKIEQTSANDVQNQSGPPILIKGEKSNKLFQSLTGDELNDLKA